MAKFRIIDWGILGAILGAITPFVLSIVSKIPPINFATIDIGKYVTGVPSGLGEKTLALIQGQIGTALNLSLIIGFAVSGAVLMIIGRTVYEMLRLKLSDLMKVSVVAIIGSILGGFILAGIIKLPTFALILPMVINGFVLGFLGTAIYKALFKKGIPD